MNNSTREAMRALADWLERHVEDACAEIDTGVKVVSLPGDNSQYYVCGYSFSTDNWFRGDVWNRAEFAYKSERLLEAFEALERMLADTPSRIWTHASNGQVLDATKSAIRDYFEPIIAMIREQGGAVEQVAGQEFAPTERQEAVLAALNGVAMLGKNLCAETNIPPNKIAGIIKPMRDAGIIKNRHGQGYYRTDAPPSSWPKVNAGG